VGTLSFIRTLCFFLEYPHTPKTDWEKAAERWVNAPRRVQSGKTAVAGTGRGSGIEQWRQDDHF